MIQIFTVQLSMVFSWRGFLQFQIKIKCYQINEKSKKILFRAQTKLCLDKYMSMYSMADQGPKLQCLLKVYVHDFVVNQK